MKLSVVIPCYNAAATLPVQLKALADQEFSEPWEVIVADNGSTDASVSIAESFRSGFPAFRLVEAGGRRGPAYARNRGAEAARGEFLVFCDADDEVASGYLNAMAKALGRHEFVACRFDFERLNRRWVARLHGSQTSGLDRGLFGSYLYAGGGSLAIRRTLHEMIGGFDEDFEGLEDTDYCLRLQRAGVTLHFVPEAVVHVRWRSTMRDSFGQARHWGQWLIAVSDRHWPMAKAPETPLSLARHLWAVRRLRTPDQCAVWIWSAGWRVGLIQGWRERRRRTGKVAGRAAGRISGGIAAMVDRAYRAAMRIRDRACGEVLRAELGSIDPSARLDYPLKVDGAEHVHIAAGVHIRAHGWIYAVTRNRDQVFNPEIRIGQRSRVGRQCHIVATRRISIGREVTVEDGVYLSDNLHDYRDVHRAITDSLILCCGEVQIGDGARLERNACVMGNVSLGEHCIVAANAVVTRDVPPYCLAAGIPARVVKHYDRSSHRWEPIAPGRGVAGTGGSPAPLAPRRYGFS